MAMSKTVQVLRWLAVLPGALLCALIVNFPIHWVVMLIQHFGSISIDAETPIAAINPEMLELLGYAFFNPFIIIISGAYIAPRFKFQTGIALAVLWGIIFGVSNTTSISQGQYSGWGWLRFVITCMLCVAGVCLGFFQVQRKGEKENQMRKFFGSIFKVFGGIAFFIFGLWGLIFELAIVNQAAGFWGVVIGIFILPVTFVAAPWYAIVEWGNWFPLLIVYGGGIVSAIFFGIGSLIAGD